MAIKTADQARLVAAQRELVIKTCQGCGVDKLMLKIQAACSATCRTRIHRRKA